MTGKEALDYIINEIDISIDKYHHPFTKTRELLKVISKDLDRLEKLDTLLGDNVLGDANTGLEIIETLIARADKYKQRCKDLQEIIDVIKTCEFDDVYAVNKKWLDKVLEEN